MGIEHDNADVGAEMDTHRESIKQFNSIITHDSHDDTNNKTTLEYIVGEGDPPFCKYRLTLELVSTHSADEFASMRVAQEERMALEEIDRQAAAE